MASVDRLFDTTDYRAPAPTHREDHFGELVDLAKQERQKTLVRGPDGYLARQVCLHSLDKAHYARFYADIVGKAMKSAYGGPTAWVELFAGPGMLKVKDLEGFKPGSPVEATGISHPFDHYIFVDQDQRCVEALSARVGALPNVHPVIQGDANSAAVHDKIVAIIPRNALVILYADPAALDLDFATIQFFADRYEHLDLLLNVPVPGFVRALGAGHEDKAARVLNHPMPSELIGPTSGKANVSLREWFERQLRGLRYEYFASEVIKQHQKRVPLYDLMLASRSPKAKQFFEEAQKRGPGGQYRFF
jgi:three-Cys-motif partner protein